MNYKFLDLAGLGSLIEKLKTIFASSSQGVHADSAYQHSLLKSGNPHKVTKNDIGLSNVENKNSATIRSELTKEEVVNALGYTPPTQDTNTTYSQATNSNLGLVKIGFPESGKNYPVELNTSGQMYVNVPWIDYTLSSFGVTATASELNKLDGCTATVTELNYCDGVTSNIQTQLNGKAASSHSHSAANITSGTLAIARGGTGGTSALTARANIDAVNILVQDSQPTSQNAGDFWLEII